MNQSINWFRLVVYVLLAELVGIISSLLSGNIGQSFASLIKPSWSPPGWVFGVIWPILYLLMGIAAYIIDQTPESPERSNALKLYWAQLAVNFIWPIIFFRFEWYWLSVLVIILLDVLVLLTTLWFYKIKRAAGWLMVPYLLWILFATFLNISIAMLN